MKNIARILALLILSHLSALAQAKYAGNWIVIVTPTKTPNPPGTTPRQLASFNVTEDGTLYGQIYDFQGDPISQVTGSVTKAGRITGGTFEGSIFRGSLVSRSRGTGTATQPGWRWTWTAFREYP